MENKVNIAIIAGQLVVGGAERQLYLWLSNLDRKRFNPIVLTLHPGHNDYWEKPIKDLGIPLFEIPSRKNRISRLIEIVRIIRPYQPKLIHGWHIFASAYAGLVSQLLRTKSLGGVRNYSSFLKNNLLEFLVTLWTVDAIVVNSSSTAKYLEQKIKRRNLKIFAVQNAVEENDTDREQTRKNIIKAFGINDNSMLIGSMGRMDPLKKFDLLIQVFSELRVENKNIHLLLIGDGPEKPRLIKLVESIGLTPFVTFTGEIPNAATWLRAFDVFAFTSLDEGMPNVIMEAAAAGLPIVTWKLPFYEELLQDGKTALLVEAEDLSAMKHAILGLIDSPEQRVQLGNAAREHILSSFSLQTYVQKMTGVYEFILSASSSTSKRTE